MEGRRMTGNTLTKEVKDYIIENSDKDVSTLHQELGLKTGVIKEVLLAVGVAKHKPKPTMKFFNNIEYIRENCDLGLKALALELRVPQEDLKNFMIVNEIPVIE